MTRTFRIVPAIALAAAFLGAAADAQTIKIGVNEPLTGAFAASGTYVVNGAKIAADEINAKGGILGKNYVTPGPLEMMSQHRTAKSAADEKYAFVRIGHCSSTLPCMRYTFEQC